MLGRPIQNLVDATEDNPAAISFDESETYTADCVIKVGYEPKVESTHVQHKAIVILAKPIRLHKPEQESSEEEGPSSESGTCENALFIIPPSKLQEAVPAQPTITLMAGEGSFSAPSGQCENFVGFGLVTC